MGYYAHTLVPSGAVLSCIYHPFTYQMQLAVQGRHIAMLDTLLERNEDRAQARLANCVTRDILENVTTEGGDVPPGFPDTLEALEGMGEESIDALLLAYGLDVEGDKAEKLQRLKHHIGIQQA
ncbi:hypothetical protein KIPB_004603 [Kipferlia bialata]|uniref:SAP domain-containing protein n=1 Tax=Kipferlia bialata TaxID=797122 RepID=A0A9K3CVP7_9EUKA|nr:hypothetical protein KIPB_004603 [Kipferlia bialata]|eukprot:g4603.t1